MSPAARAAATLLAVAAAGAGLAGQARVNGALTSRLGGGPGGAVLTATVSFTVGLLLVAAAGGVRAAHRARAAPGLPPSTGPGRRLPAMPGPRWERLGGLGGALAVVTASAGAPRLGVAAVSVLVVAGQVSGGLLVDAAGLAAGGRVPPTARRLGGAALAVGASLLAARHGARGAHAGVLLPCAVAAGGTAIAVQQAANGRLAARAGGPRGAALVSFCCGTSALAALTAALRLTHRLPAGTAATLRGLGHRPLLLVGGAAGAVFISVAAAVVGRLGVLQLSLAAVAGQLAAAVLLDGLAPAAGAPPLSPAAVAGVLLAGAGVLVGARRPTAAAGTGPPAPASPSAGAGMPPADRRASGRWWPGRAARDRPADPAAAPSPAAPSPAAPSPAAAPPPAAPPSAAPPPAALPAGVPPWPDPPAADPVTVGPPPPDRPAGSSGGPDLAAAAGVAEPAPAPARPDPTAALLAALRGGDAAAALTALPTATVLVPIRARAAAGMDAELELVELAGARGRRLLAFTSAEALRRFDPRGRPTVLTGARLLSAAHAGGYAGVVLDIAGPHPLTLTATAPPSTPAAARRSHPDAAAGREAAGSGGRGPAAAVVTVRPPSGPTPPLRLAARDVPGVESLWWVGVLVGGGPAGPRTALGLVCAPSVDPQSLVSGPVPGVIARAVDAAGEPDAPAGAADGPPGGGSGVDLVVLTGPLTAAAREVGVRAWPAP